MNKVTIEVFLSDLNELKHKMGQGKNYLSPEAHQSGLKKQLFEYRQKEKQIQEEIEREIEDFFSYMYLKKASIEALKNIGGYVSQEAHLLEEQVNKKAQ